MSPAAGREAAMDPSQPQAVPLAILLEGVSENWGMNVLQILGHPTLARVVIDGHGTVEAPAIRLSREQARHLATQIVELLGMER